MRGNKSFYNPIGAFHCAERQFIKMNKPVVYIIIKHTETDEKNIRRISGYLPEYRLEKAEKYFRLSDRNNCIISYFLLMYGLEKNFGIRKLPAISADTYGKPYFPDCDISFSISHCDTGVCCGIARNTIGADIQSRVTDFEDILGTVMSSGEIELICGAKSPDTEFAKYWSLKESIVKYRGTGINDELDKFDFSKCVGREFVYNGLMFRTEIMDGCCISACSGENAPVFVNRSIEEYIDEFLSLHNDI